MIKHRKLQRNKLKGYIGQLAKTNQLHNQYSDFAWLADNVFNLVEFTDKDEVDLLVRITEAMGTNTRIALQAIKLIQQFLNA